VHREGQFLRLCYIGIQYPWEINISEEEQWAKVITDRKRSYIEKNCFKNSHTTTAVQLNSSGGPVSTKTARREIRKCNIHCRATSAKPLITESNAQMRKCNIHGRATSAKPLITESNAQMRKCNINCRAASAKPLITESNAQMRKCNIHCRATSAKPLITESNAQMSK
jgi:hypothetical protein